MPGNTLGSNFFNDKKIVSIVKCKKWVTDDLPLAREFMKVIPHLEDSVFFSFKKGESLRSQLQKFFLKTSEKTSGFNSIAGLATSDFILVNTFFRSGLANEEEVLHTPVPVRFRAWAVLFHELTHFICNQSNYLFLKSKDKLFEFYFELYSKCFSSSNLSQYPKSIAGLYVDLLRSATSGESEKLHNTLYKNLKSFLLKNSSKASDKKLLEQILEVANILNSAKAESVAMALLKRKLLQETFRQVYDQVFKLGNVATRTTLFGQEILIPSEVLAVVAGDVIFKNKYSMVICKSILQYFLEG